MQERRMQERKDSGDEGFRRGRIQEMKDSGEEGCRR